MHVVVIARTYVHKHKLQKWITTSNSFRGCVNKGCRRGKKKGVLAADLYTILLSSSTPLLRDNAQEHPERFCHCCHQAMQRVISGRAEGVGVH